MMASETKDRFEEWWTLFWPPVGLATEDGLPTPKMIAQAAYHARDAEIERLKGALAHEAELVGDANTEAAALKRRVNELELREVPNYPPTRAEDAGVLKQRVAELEASKTLAIFGQDKAEILRLKTLVAKLTAVLIERQADEIRTALLRKTLEGIP